MVSTLDILGFRGVPLGVGFEGFLVPQISEDS